MNAHLPVGRFAGHSRSLSRPGAWLTAFAAIVILAVADSHFPGLGLTLLYIPIICASCWALGARAGYPVAAVCAALALLPHLAGQARSSLLLSGLPAIVRTAAFLFVAVIVSGFRRSYDRQRYWAAHDRMTGALDKEAFRERVNDRLRIAARTRRTLLLAMLDLDDFKGVNSRHGHMAGDAVLRVFARGAGAMVRPEDDFGRIGGDEFAFLIPVPSVGEGRRVALALHGRLSAVLGGAPYRVTCSMGALLIPPDAPRDEAALMHMVDRLMYAVKRAGKNAVEIGEAGIGTGREAGAGGTARSDPAIRERVA